MLSHNMAAHDPKGGQRCLQVYPAVLRKKKVKTILEPNDDLNPGLSAEEAQRAKWFPKKKKKMKQSGPPKKKIPKTNNHLKVRLFRRPTTLHSQENNHVDVPTTKVPTDKSKRSPAYPTTDMAASENASSSPRRRFF